MDMLQDKLSSFVGFSLLIYVMVLNSEVLMLLVNGYGTVGRVLDSHQHDPGPNP